MSGFVRLHSVFIVQREVYTALKTLCMGHLAFRWSLTVCMDVANLCVSTCQVEVKAKSASMFLSDYLELSYFCFLTSGSAATIRGSCCHPTKGASPTVYGGMRYTLTAGLCTPILQPHLLTAVGLQCWLHRVGKTMS